MQSGARGDAKKAGGDAPPPAAPLLLSETSDTTAKQLLAEAEAMIQARAGATREAFRRLPPVPMNKDDLLSTVDFDSNRSLRQHLLQAHENLKKYPPKRPDGIPQEEWERFKADVKSGKWAAEQREKAMGAVDDEDEDDRPLCVRVLADFIAEETAREEEEARAAARAATGAGPAGARAGGADADEDGAKDEPWWEKEVIPTLIPETRDEIRRILSGEDGDSLALPTDQIVAARLDSRTREPWSIVNDDGTWNFPKEELHGAALVNKWVTKYSAGLLPEPLPLSEEREATAHVILMCHGCREQAQFFVQADGTVEEDFDDFFAQRFCVDERYGGIRYFVKVQTGRSGMVKEYAHVMIYEPTERTGMKPQVLAVELGHTAESPIRTMVPDFGSAPLDPEPEADKED